MSDHIKIPDNRPRMIKTSSRYCTNHCMTLDCEFHPTKECIKGVDRILIWNVMKLKGCCSFTDGKNE